VISESLETHLLPSEDRKNGKRVRIGGERSQYLFETALVGKNSLRQKFGKIT
jgi:hypothetical protein